MTGPTEALTFDHGVVMRLVQRDVLLYQLLSEFLGSNQAVAFEWRVGAGVEEGGVDGRVGVPSPFQHLQF